MHSAKRRAQADASRSKRRYDATIPFGLGPFFFHVASTVYLVLIFGVPVLVLIASWSFFHGSYLQWFMLLLSPFFYTTTMAVISGLLSLCHQRSIIAGTFSRDLNSILYLHRRLYGTCWTALFYCKPVYYLCLSIPVLKWLVFRLFGYRGTLEFTVYPDTWIRDLPLLRLGRGAYLSNRATIGTNIVLANGTILVDQINVGDGACIGHLTMLAPGSSIGSFAEVGVGCGIGIKTRLGPHASVGGFSGIEHGVQIGARVRVGARSYIGSCSFVADDLIVPAASSIPGRRRVDTPENAKAFLCSTTLACTHTDRARSDPSSAEQASSCREIFWRRALTPLDS